MIEPDKNGFKYIHNSYYFENYHQAAGFLKDVKNIDEQLLDSKNTDLFVPKHDVLIQCHGIRSSVHFIYPLLSMKQSDFDQESKFEKFKVRKSEFEKKLSMIRSELKNPLAKNDFIRVRLTNKARTETYSMIDYSWLYQNHKNCDRLNYEIVHTVQNNGQMKSKPSEKFSSLGKITKSKLSKTKILQLLFKNICLFKYQIFMFQIQQKLKKAF